MVVVVLQIVPVRKRHNKSSLKTAQWLTLIYTQVYVPHTYSPRWPRKSSGESRSRPRNVHVFSSIIRRYVAVAPGPRLRSSNLRLSRQFSELLAVETIQSISSLKFRRCQGRKMDGRQQPGVAYIFWIGNIGRSAYISPRFSRRSLTAGSEDRITIT